MSLRTSEQAVSPVLGTVLMIGIAIMMSAVTFVLVGQYTEQNERTPFPGIHMEAQNDRRELYVMPAVGDPVPIQGSKLLLEIDGEQGEYFLASLPQFQDNLAGSWGASKPVCLVGPDELCFASNAKEVKIHIIHDNVIVFYGESVYLRAFTILPGGGIGVNCAGPVDMQVIGVEITYGPGGPDIPVWLLMSENGGSDWEDHFGTNVVAGDEYNDPWVKVDAVLALRGTADYSPDFYSSRDSHIASEFVEVLANGDTAPVIEGWDDQTDVAEFLAPYVDIATNKVTIDDNQVIVLWEFSSDPDSPAADYQDLVVLFTFPDDCIAE